MQASKFIGRAFACAVAFAVAFFTGHALAQSPKWEPHVDVEVKPGNNRSLGTADLFVPLSQNADTLFFGNLRARLADHDDFEGNIGLGVRRMTASGWNLGTYAYFDRRRSPNGSMFSQATLGAEALGRDWDLRANVYQPLGARQRDLGTANTAVFSANTLLVNSQTTYERALGGYDAELGWRAPVFDAEDKRQLRLYLGGYHFSGGGANVSGPRVRAEYTVADLNGLWRGAQLTVGAESQKDDVRGRQNFVSLRLRIPFGGSTGTSAPLNAQERRMSAPVMRDVDIVNQSMKTAPVIDPVIGLSSGQALTVINSAVTSGTAMKVALAAAGNNSFVLLNGTFATTYNTMYLKPGQTVMGAGLLSVRTASGRSVTIATPRATVISEWSDTFVVTNAPNVTISGLELVKTTSPYPVSGGLAISIDNSNNATISNNIIRYEVASERMIGIQLLSSANATVTGNDVSVRGAYSSAIEVIVSSATISGNTFNAFGPNVFVPAYASYFQDSVIKPGSTGNTLVSGQCFLYGTSGSLGYNNAPSCGQ